MPSRSRWLTVGIAAFWGVVAVLVVVGIVLIVLTASGAFSIE